MYNLSRYNYVIPFQDRFIYFNGLTSHSFSVSKDEDEWIQTEFKDLLHFHSNFTSIFEKFKQWGYIVKSDEDERDVIRMRNHYAVFLNKFYRLNISPTMDCNFSCWYCPQKHHKSKMSAETIVNMKRHIEYMVNVEKITGLYLDWFGGEPTLCFNDVVYPISLYAKEILENNHLPLFNYITSNGFLINRDMATKMAEIDLTHFQITIDGEEKRHNKIRNAKGTPSYSKIIENICLLCEVITQVKIDLRINYDDKSLTNNALAKMFDQIPIQHRNNISPIYQRVWQTYENKIDRTDELIKLHESNISLGYKNSTLTAAFNLFPGVRCYGDRYYYAAFNYDGKVYKCTGRDYEKIQVAGEILENGRLSWDEKMISKLYAKPNFDNDKCLECKHLPICIGPCHNNKGHQCALDTEISPENFIIDVHKRRIREGKEIIENEKRISNIGS